MVNGMSKNLFLINAPAGSGKTTTIRRKLVDIFSENKKANVLCITFTNRAVAELQKVVVNKNATICTIHTFVHNFINPFFKEREALELYWELFEDKIDEKLNGTSETNERYKEKFGGISKDIIKLNLTELSYGETQFTSLYYGKLSHDDLLRFTYLFTNRYPKILKKISCKYSFIFIDEYQDTSTDILKLFYNAVKGTNVELYLFGDKMQQIYRNYDGVFENELKEFNSDVKLRTNYRSSNEIVSLLNKLYNNEEYAQDSEKGNLGVIPRLLISDNIKRDVSRLQMQDSGMLTLYLMNRDKYKEIGAEDLFVKYTQMESYSYGRKYSATDILSDFSRDNPDVLMCMLFILNNLRNYLLVSNYGALITLCKQENKYFNVDTFSLKSHADKEALKEKLQSIIDIDYTNANIENVLEVLFEKRLLKDSLKNKIFDNEDYQEVLKVPFQQVINLANFLNDPTVSTQHGVKGEGYDSVLFVANNDCPNPNVRMYKFFELISKNNLSLTEFEDFYYKYSDFLQTVESSVGCKSQQMNAGINNTYKEMFINYCWEAINKFGKSDIFLSLCQNNYKNYIKSPTLQNAKEMLKITVVEGVLTAYKLFYVGCSRARTKLTVIVEKRLINKYKEAFFSKFGELGFKVVEQLTE